MRIALVSDPYSPRVGGIETQVRNLGQALAAAGHSVTVITATPTTSPRGDFTELDGEVTVRRLTAHIPLDLPVNPFAREALEQALPSFDVVHIHMGLVSPFARMAVQACIKTGTRAILTWHSHLGGSTWWYGAVNPLPAWESAGIRLTAVSAPAARAVATAARGNAQVAVLPNLIFDEPWEQARQAALPHFNEEATSAPLRAVTATRLAPRKRVLQLAEIARRARVDVHVYGDGCLRPALARPGLSGGRLHLHGKVMSTQLADAYTRAEVFVSPVVKEAFGIAALEARACGLPVIYRQGSGIEEFITHGRDGLETSSDKEMAAALAMLAKHPQRLKKLREYALQNRITHTWSRGLQTYLELYEDWRN